MDTKTAFEKWLYSGGTTSDSPSYINHAISVLDSWLNEKLPYNKIGSLFRFTDYDSYSRELERIRNLPDFDKVNKSDQNGRPKAALNKYAEFLQQRNIAPYKFKQTSYIIANIAWNSSGWKGVTDDKTNFKWTQIEGNIPHESWNFDFENHRNSFENIYGFLQFTSAPKKSEENNFFIVFRSKDKQGKNKIVGFYGDAEILKEAKIIDNKSSVNIRAKRNLCILLENAIDDSDNVFLFGKQKVGQIGFNNISKANSLSIVSEALKINQNQITELNRIRNWIESTIPSNYAEKEGESEMSKAEELAKLLKNTRNLILHGAPGTGKTHLARDIAKVMNAEVGFVQFHPSYDYTDFVEGLRPVNTGKTNQIGFNRKDGVFKKFCETALQNYLDSKKSFEQLKQETSLKDKVNNFIDESMEKKITFKTVSNTEFFIERDIEDDDILLISIPRNEIYNKIQLKVSSIIQILSFKEVPKAVTELKTIFNHKVSRQEDSYYFALMQEILKQNSKKEINVENIHQKPFIFIIDEINRGEMSKIFGELFFAIEPNYRGAEKCKDLRTQYANLQIDQNLFDFVLGIKEKDNFGHFFIPENVYIIGTMNDIDRNVESMDFAFRRRFTFKEIMAKDTQEQILAELDDSIRDEAINRMDSLNDAISNIEGLSSAYHIGGAYFLKLKELGNDFELLWDYHLEGLLREYLRGMEDSESKLEDLKEAYNQEA